LPALLVGLALAGLSAWLILEGGQNFERLQAIHRKLDAAQNLKATSAQYGQRVAQLMREGREQQANLRATRLDMERGFVQLTQEARNRAALAPNEAETRELLTDVELARRMLELYHAIDLSAARAFVLIRDGDPAGAEQIYQRDVDFRLDTEFASLLDNAIARETQRLEEEGDAQERLWRLGVAAGAILSLLLVAALAIAWGRIARIAETVGPELVAEFEKRADELRDANRRLREIDARRAQFLADVSHELRTPLTILRGEADVGLLAATAPAEQRRALERIQDQAAELGQLLDDLIAFARSDGEAQTFAPHRLLLDDIVATVVEEGEALAEPREVGIELTLPEKGVWVDADIRRLKQALIIGLDNAINHSPPGSVIAVGLERSGDRASITIADNGTGLLEADASRVFERFYRGGQAGNSFGLGIGLAIAKAIVEQHNGSIALANRPEGGALLRIELPVPREARP
jgi:signal transduction histidine kinase